MLNVYVEAQDLVELDNNWIPGVRKSNRKVKPTLKSLSNFKSQLSKGSSKRLPVAETKIRPDSVTSSAYAELHHVAIFDWAALFEAEGNG